MDERCYNCYRFAKSKPVCGNGFSFDMDCFIYGDQVDDFDVENLTNDYLPEIDYVLMGMLKKEEYASIIACLLNSRSVKNKIKRFLREP